MDPDSLTPLVEDLSSEIDNLTAALEPLLQTSLSTSASRLPLLDKAKLYVLATYTIESLLFSYLRLHGTDAKSHPVFQELNRVKSYFSKIQNAEGQGTENQKRVDKEAAGRFIKHGLAGNDRYDRERAEMREKERAGAKRKLEEVSVGKHTRFDGAAKRIKTAEREEKIRVVRAEDADTSEAGEEDGDGDSSMVGQQSNQTMTSTAQKKNPSTTTQTQLTERSADEDSYSTDRASISNKTSASDQDLRSQKEKRYGLQQKAEDPIRMEKKRLKRKAKKEKQKSRRENN